MMVCTQQHAGQIGRNSRMGIDVSQGQLDLRAERVARKKLEMPQPHQGVLPDYIVPLFDLRPVGVDRHQTDKYSRRALVRTSREDHVVAGFEGYTRCCLGFQRTSFWKDLGNFQYQ
jgi:hypothetical protein